MNGFCQLPSDMLLELINNIKGEFSDLDVLIWLYLNRNFNPKITHTKPNSNGHIYNIGVNQIVISLSGCKSTFNFKSNNRVSGVISRLENSGYIVADSVSPENTMKTHGKHKGNTTRYNRLLITFCFSKGCAISNFSSENTSGNTLKTPCVSDGKVSINNNKELINKESVSAREETPNQIPPSKNNLAKPKKEKKDSAQKKENYHGFELEQGIDYLAFEDLYEPIQQLLQTHQLFFEQPELTEPFVKLWIPFLKAEDPTLKGGNLQRKLIAHLRKFLELKTKFNWQQPYETLLDCMTRQIERSNPYPPTKWNEKKQANYAKNKQSTSNIIAPTAATRPDGRAFDPAKVNYLGDDESADWGNW